MIDTSRYAGHTPGLRYIVRQGGDYWIQFGVDPRTGKFAYECPVDMPPADLNLTVDSLELLAEVERLQGEVAALKAAAREYRVNSTPFPFDDSRRASDRLDALCGEVDNG